MNQDTNILIPKKKVIEMTSLSNSTIFRMQRKGQFPKRIQISKGRVAWREADVVDWIQSRTEGTEI